VPNVLLTAPLTSEGPWNSSHFKNPAYDKLVADYVAAFDLETQRAVAKQIQELLLDETARVVQRAALRGIAVVGDVDAHRTDIVALTNSVDDEWIRAARSPAELPLGVQYELQPLPQPVPILVGEVRRETNPRNGREMTVALEDQYAPEMMQDFAVFAPTRSVPMARAYVLPREAPFGLIVDKLRQHGIAVEELTASLTTEVTSFVVDTVARAQRPFQGHHEVTLKGEYVTDRQSLPAGTIVVRLAQPLGRLAAYLLEPESDDGLVAWNFFDAWLESGKVAPVRKIMGVVEMATRPLDRF